MRHFFLILFFITFLVISPITYGAQDRQPKTVGGKVYNPDGSFAEGAEVSVQCNTHVLNDVVSKYGNYEVIFTENECRQFDSVSVFAILEGLTGSASKEVQYYKGVTMDDIILQAVAVPEFGAFSAIMAGSISVLAYTAIRRKQ